MLNTIITSSVLIVVLLLLRTVFIGKIRPGLQYALWLLVVVRLLVPLSLFASPMSILNVAHVGNWAQPAITSTPLQASSETVSNPPAQTTPVEGNQLLSASVTNHPAVNTNTTPASGISLPDILRIIWLSGTAATGLWFAIQNANLYIRLRKTREKVTIDGQKLFVYLTKAVKSPCLFGFIRPAIYLTPDSLIDEQTKQYILAHELTHYRHGDHLWSYLRCVCLAVYWFNPLVWLAAGLSRCDCEMACDEGTLNRIGNDHRQAYGHMLVNMISSHTALTDLMSGATMMTSGKSGIKERITLIAKKPKMLVTTLTAVLLIVAILAGCTFTGAKDNSNSSSASQASKTLIDELSQKNLSVSSNLIAAFYHYDNRVFNELRFLPEIVPGKELSWDYLTLFVSDYCTMTGISNSDNQYSMTEASFDHVVSQFFSGLQYTHHSSQYFYLKDNVYHPVGFDLPDSVYYRLTDISKTGDIYTAKFDGFAITESDMINANISIGANLKAVINYAKLKTPLKTKDVQDTLLQIFKKSDYAKDLRLDQRIEMTFTLSGQTEPALKYLSCHREYVTDYGKPPGVGTYTPSDSSTTSTESNYDRIADYLSQITSAAATHNLATLQTTFMSCNIQYISLSHDKSKVIFTIDDTTPCIYFIDLSQTKPLIQNVSKPYVQTYDGFNNLYWSYDDRYFSTQCCTDIKGETYVFDTEHLKLLYQGSAYMIFNSTWSPKSNAIALSIVNKNVKLSPNDSECSWSSDVVVFNAATLEKRTIFKANSAYYYMNIVWDNSGITATREYVNSGSNSETKTDTLNVLE